MAEEVSKRLDDLHRRFDDLRAGMNQRFDAVDRRFDDLRGDMTQRFTELRGDMTQRFDDVNRRLTDMNGTLRTFMWIVSGWFTFLTAVLAVFGFLRV